ncbi:MAG: DUF2189 domain-containing protein [Gammaproteobacteria bacterium]
MRAGNRLDVFDGSELLFHINDVGLSRPFAWLLAGWDDLRHSWPASLAHGLLVSALGMVILLFASTHIYYVMAAVSGFLLLGPVMATGLCELSRRRALGESISFDDSLSGMNRNRDSFRLFAATLLGFSLLWFLLSGLILEVLFGQVTPTIAETLWSGFLDIITPTQLLIYLLTGGILACLVFVYSVVSVPAMLDRPISAMTAMKMSVRTVIVNFRTMLIWSALIVILTAVGFMTLLLGFVVIYPLLGHATWHAYKDIVR